MVIYGWNSKNIKEAPLEGYECPKCNEKASILAIFAHYVHIFWIPLFPYKKSASIVCTQCQLQSNEKDMLEDTRATVKKLKSVVSIPKYLFSGLILLILAVSYFTYAASQEAKLEQSYIDNPQIGDVYIVQDMEEVTEYDHYLLKVVDITNDSLWVSFSSYHYNGIVSELDPADGFYDVMFPIHKNGLVQYQELGELKKVMRDYSEAAGFNRVIEYEEDSLLLN